MCNKCDEIDQVVVRYLRLKRQVNDRQTHEAADRLLAKLEADKRVLHPPTN